MSVMAVIMARLQTIEGNYAFDLQDKVVKLQFFKATGGELLENNLKVFKNSSKVQYHFEVQRFMDSAWYFNTPKRQRHQRQRLNLIQFCTLNTTYSGWKCFHNLFWFHPAPTLGALLR